ncbi:nitrate- and nitrite sensing domain-containing protein, partial [Streptomyces sp. UNOC14_S4]|uniref:nitrate- and nitrite sensing domain-containing protein n=1 Tax=Streptomyces sp. UNOC14_S4 TaxID=2872340 RepID=UPI001E4A54F5
MQGRFKREGSAAAEPEPRGATDRGTSADAPTGGESAERSKSKAKVKAKAKAKAKGSRKGAAKGASKGADAPAGPGSRIALRNWRISTRLVSLLALPVVAATTLGALRIDSSLENVDQLDHMKLLTDMTGKATQLASALQEERDKSAGPISDATGGRPDDDRIVSTRQRSDKAIQAFQDATGAVKPNDSTMVGVQTTLVDITRQLAKIKNIRENAYKNPDFIAQTVSGYDSLINSLLALSQDMAQATNNSDMITSTRALATFSSAKEYASVQRAVITSALARKKLTDNDRQYADEARQSENEAIKRFTAIRSDDAKSLLQALNGGVADVTSANAFAERVLSRSDGIKDPQLTWMDWSDQSGTKLSEMSKVETTLLNQMEQKARELRDEAQQEAILNGVLIVLVLGISLVGAFVVARSMVRSLRRLQDTAQKVAQERLPELVKQLSETDPQDVDTSVESVGVHSTDEIGKVASAFDDVHREAVRLAAEQALLRGNVNAMFTNLSRRSQGLIQRQLSLISELESREADPDQLSSLFKLDHLATRMRRNGENLLVLAGEEPGRRWTRPVPLVDVLRAAASEVEQYERIELSGVPPTEIAGRVVNDLVHLLAELLENATSFSSPQTKVKVTGHALPDGRVLVEIHDTGIGLSPEDLASINERLASPPTVDVSVSRRMGLFVVGRLSLRHGVRIQLRPSDSGGTTALVMLPVDVAQGGKRPMPGAAGAPGQGGAPSAPGGKGSPGLMGQMGQMGQMSQMSQMQRRQTPPAGPGGANGAGNPPRPAFGDSRPATPQNGLAQNGLAQNGLPQNGLSRNSAPRSGPTQNGLPQRPAATQNGLPQRPATTQSGLPQRPTTTQSGLPTRNPGAAAPGAPASSGGGSVFDAAPRGGANGKGDGSSNRGAVDPAVIPPASENVRRPQMPRRRGSGPVTPPGAKPDLPTRKTPSWGSQEQATPKPQVDDWPTPSADRVAQDAPRGHQDPATAAPNASATSGGFALPAGDRQSDGPGATAQFPAVTPPAGPTGAP